MTNDEIDSIANHWNGLDARLRSFEPDDVRLHLYLKDRDTPSQHLTVEARIAGLPSLVATSSETDLDVALNVVRDEMIRLVGDAKETHRARDTERFGSA
ncbi:MAG: hypothetical protein ABJ314_23125 [Ilumatobacter sp.]